MGRNGRRQGRGSQGRDGSRKQGKEYLKRDGRRRQGRGIRGGMEGEAAFVSHFNTAALPMTACHPPKQLPGWVGWIWWM